ncbi:unnamed protein product [Arabis nemorensis]|uniref:Uncharacterized protein n=1 Tax=Arabis nemorensis TaxID=586526 RepID=A0A565BK53_9BRAS|nr:unnamed protein product [Arabis nemorensis]
MYVPVIFFYKAEHLATMSPQIISGKLKTSLSQTLSRFYPLAGRIKGLSVSCNDEGAVFTEARTDLLLSDFLENMVNMDSLDRFSPTTIGDSPTEWPLLSVKVTFFGSGSGVAVSVSVSHRICDAASLLTFVTDWATTTAKGKSNDTIHFAETTIYPPPDHVSLQFPPTDSNIVNSTSKCVTNRLVFESTKIAELKRKAASESVHVPTRVEAISALVLKCARNASRSNSVVPRIPSTLLSRDAIGNLHTSFFVKKDAENDLDIFETVAAFRKAKVGVNEMIKENLESNTLGQYLFSLMGSFEAEVKPDIDIYSMSSWCRKPFYEVDFGWGSPVLIGSFNKMFVWLMVSKDGDCVEVWIGLPEQDMHTFLRDQDLLAYAIVNPPVLI